MICRPATGHPNARTHRQQTPAGRRSAMSGPVTKPLNRSNARVRNVPSRGRAMAIRHAVGPVCFLLRGPRPRTPRGLCRPSMSSHALRHRGRMGFAHGIRPTDLGARSSLRYGQGTALDPVRHAPSGVPGTRPACTRDRMVRLHRGAPTATSSIGRAPGLHPGGWGFDSLVADHHPSGRR